MANSRSSRGLKSGLSSGLSAGMATGNPLIGLGVGAGTYIASLLSKSPEEEREQRYKEYLAKRAEVRKTISDGYDATLNEGSQRIGKLTSGLASRFRNSAGSRAAALGRVGDTEAFEVPVVGQVANAGSNAMQEFQYNSGEQKARDLDRFDMETLNVDASYADRPIETDAIDYVDELAPLAVQYSQNKQLINAMTPKTNTGVVTPNNTAIPLRTDISFKRPQEIPVSEDIIEGIPTYRRKRQSQVDLPISYYRR